MIKVITNPGVEEVPVLWHEAVPSVHNTGAGPLLHRPEGDTARVLGSLYQLHHLDLGKGDSQGQQCYHSQTAVHLQDS